MFVCSFTREVLKMLYRGYKTECPSGVLTEECFHYAYTAFFPGRDTEPYNGHCPAYRDTLNLIKLAV